MARLTTAQMHEHCERLLRADRAFRGIVRDAALCPFGRVRPTSTHFKSLVRAVTAQQVSTAAARSIFAKLVAAVGGEMTPESVDAAPHEALRAAGLSAAKTRTVSELAAAATSGAIDFRTLARRRDETIVAELTAVHGIGRWTAEMFLMFQLGRLDVWPVGDLAVRRGWDNLHHPAPQVTPSTLTALGERFRGYRSVAAWYCWRAS